MRVVPEGWREVRFGGEGFWFREGRRVSFLLGFGPALGEGGTADRLCTVMRAPDFPFRAVYFGDQVHGRLIASLGEETERPFAGVASVGVCDGLITDVIGLGVAVWTADCVPVLLAGDGVVSVVHAGWRGAAAGIVCKAVRRFEVEYGVSAQALEVVLGPAVASCHYEVGSEVISALAGGGPPDSMWRRGKRVDLRDFLSAQLLDLGVDRTAIQRIGPCTACDSELASFRRDGLDAGRQVAMVGLT
jgi:YfiH family protein